MKETLPTVPLSGDDKEILQTIYSTRYKYFIATYGGFLAFLVYYIIMRDEYVMPAVMKGDYTGAVEEFFMRYTLTIVIVLTAMTVIYMKRIRAYSQDYKGGCKECVPYVITMKQYFGNTGQYFIGLDDPNYLHHEVDADFYNQVSEGDTVVLHRGPKSQYVFNARGRFTLM